MCLSVFVFHDRGEIMPENTEYTPPRTLREKLTRERAELYQTREIIYKAVTELIGGAAVVSYSLQNRSCTRTRADLNSLKAYLAELDSKISEIEAVLSGRPLRQSTTNVYVNPTNCVPSWWYR